MQPKILLVDDIDTNLLLVRNYLRKTDATLVESLVSSEALQLAQNEEFALMILDIQMPKMDGFELARKIREESLNKLTPIIFLTGVMINEDNIYQGYSSGAVDYIIKPIKRTIIVSKVNIFLQIYNQRKKIEKQKRELELNYDKLKKADEEIIKSVIEGEDHERQRIARELHDGLGQYLTASSLNFNSMKDALLNLKGKKHKQFVNGLDFLHKAIIEARDMSHKLMPKEIDDFGLVISLESLFEKINESDNAKLKFIHNLNKVELNKNLEVNIYRITQELLNNALKYSEASEITLQIRKHDEELIYLLEDNGIGFNPKKMQEENHGYGINNILNRVKSLGGSTEIDSKPGKGCTTIIHLPL